jgi:hypothetical protein
MVPQSDPLAAEPLGHSPVIIAATELGNRQSRIKPHGVMPGRLFAFISAPRAQPCAAAAFSPAGFSLAFEQFI